jgi:hypothetical protein
MTNIKESIQHDIRNYLIGSPLSDGNIEEICRIVRCGFESYPPAPQHPDTMDDHRWDNEDFDTDMTTSIYN